MSKASAYDRVLEGLRSRGRKNIELLHLLQFDWPLSQFVLEKICEYISDQIYADQEPVIYEIIEGALARYSQAVHAENESKIEDPIRFGIFIEALISETSRVLEIEIRDSQGCCWTIESGISFGEWYRNRQDPESLEIHRKEHQNEKSLRSALYELITSEQIRHVLRRVNYEEAVLAGGMAAGH
ncbi:MAG: hypothetical protein SWN10_13640 [Pseudomonadota bacterium]|nr:hypothetical protein [Pseudomonadota bacterium]